MLWSTSQTLQATLFGVRSTPSQAVTPVSRKRWILFTAWYILLLKSLYVSYVHTQLNGPSRFEDALYFFLTSVSLCGLANISNPSWKIFINRFKNILSDHRAPRSNNDYTSDVLKVRVDVGASGWYITLNGLVERTEKYRTRLTHHFRSASDGVWSVNTRHKSSP